jgi:predicted RNA-binding Zn-ribbon protein involved in translation (DUF1610 family)
MTQEKKQKALITPAARAGTEKEAVDKSRDKSLVAAPEEPPRKRTGSTQTRPARKKKRATRAEMAHRNAAVTTAAIEFQTRHGRPPTVGEIAAETGCSRQQIYSTTSYKEGKIARNSSKSTSSFMAGKVDRAERIRGKQLQGPETRKQPLSEQIELAGPADGQDAERKVIGTTEPTERDSSVCYLCGCEIPVKRDTDWRCPRCGKSACSSCLELMDHMHGLCIHCKRKANKRKDMWDTIGLVGVILLIIITLVFIALIK